MTFIDALRQQEQCDEEGVMCIVSRQAVDEAIQEVERLRQQIADCAEYMKDGETPAECIKRNRGEMISTGRWLAKERKKAEELEAQLNKPVIESEWQELQRKYKQRGERMKAMRKSILDDSDGSPAVFPEWFDENGEPL